MKTNKTLVELELDEVSLDVSDQLVFLQDRGYTSEMNNEMKFARDDLEKLRDRAEEIKEEYVKWRSEWSFLW